MSSLLQRMCGPLCVLPTGNTWWSIVSSPYCSISHTSNVVSFSFYYYVAYFYLANIKHSIIPTTKPFLIFICTKQDISPPWEIESSAICSPHLIRYLDPKHTFGHRGPKNLWSNICWLLFAQNMSKGANVLGKTEVCGANVL